MIEAPRQDFRELRIKPYLHRYLALGWPIRSPWLTRGLRQPWRSYWPPKCEITMQIWLYSEFPEVLSWRFDHRQPFDRPWRTWTRSARALEERATSLPCRPM